MRIAFQLTAALVLVCNMAASAESRVFTENATGRIIYAEIQSATADNVTLKLENGTVTVVPLARLSKPDQDFVQSWAKTPPVAQATAPSVPQKLNFKVEWYPARIGNKLRPTKEMDPRAMMQGRGNLTTEEIMAAAGRPFHENWMCHFKFSNLSRVPLTNLQVDYEVWLNQKDSNKKSRIRVQEGTLTIPLLDALKNASADTPAFKCWGNQTTETLTRKGPQGQTLTYSGNTHLFLEEVEGVVITLKNNGEPIYKFESPEIKNLRNLK